MAEFYPAARARFGAQPREGDGEGEKEGGTSGPAGHRWPLGQDIPIGFGKVVKLSHCWIKERCH